MPRYRPQFHSHTTHIRTYAHIHIDAHLCTFAYTHAHSRNSSKYVCMCVWRPFMKEKFFITFLIRFIISQVYKAQYNNQTVAVKKFKVDYDALSQGLPPMDLELIRNEVLCVYARACAHVCLRVFVCVCAGVCLCAGVWGALVSVPLVADCWLLFVRCVLVRA